MRNVLGFLVGFWGPILLVPFLACRFHWAERALEWIDAKFGE